jgi:antitoxin Phd_YefM of type II toxin-antitoxin system
MNWKLAEAKSRFSEVVRLALTKGPQRILRRDDAVVLLSEQEYEILIGRKLGFKNFLLNSPDLTGLDLARSTETMRDSSL